MSNIACRDGEKTTSYPGSKPKPSLLALPAELRNRIYELALVWRPWKTIPVLGGYESKQQVALHRLMHRARKNALTQVNKQLRHETAPIYFGHNTVSLVGFLPACKPWFSRNAPHVQHIRRVSIVFRHNHEHDCRAILDTDEGGTTFSLQGLNCTVGRDLDCEARNKTEKIQGIIDASDDGKLDADGYARVIDVLSQGSRCDHLRA